MKRNIITIDEAKCNGCGICVNACAEGAIALVNGKAKLVSEIYCDGLGVCIGECPVDAIKIEQREAGAFDEGAVKARLKEIGRAATPEPVKPQMHSHGGGCPGMMARSFKKKEAVQPSGSVSAEPAVSELEQWPIQLHLVPVAAPYWKGADLLVCADCVPFACPDFHSKWLKGRKIAIACPKLDETGEYVEKLTQIIANNGIKSVTAIHMEVPCCSGIVGMARQALDAAGVDIPFHDVVVSIGGEIEER